MDRVSALWGMERLRRGLVVWLQDKQGASIFVRMIQSKHLVDLQLIAFVIYLLTFIFALVVLSGAAYHTLLSGNWKLYWPPYSWSRWWPIPRFFGDALAVAIPIVGAYLFFAGGVLAWCYQSGNARLGVVDLFACEMTTLCRVCTIMRLTETCVRAVENADASTRARFRHFESTEGYTPVFDANASDLKVLDVEVVTNVTAFYTYWKAMRDSFRHLAGAFGDNSADNDNEAWVHAMSNIIYMQFLAFESARKAVFDLIEFEPRQAENTITILLSELPAFGFLYSSFFEDDVRYRRLELRMRDYPAIIAHLNEVTKRGVSAYPKASDRAELSPRELETASGWDKASETLDALNGSYQLALTRVQKGPRRKAA